MNLGAISENWHGLEPFLPPRSKRRLVFIGVTSFLGSLAESAVLVMITLVADVLIRGDRTVTVAGAVVTPTAAVLVALCLIVGRMLMVLVSSRTSSTFAAEVMQRAQAALIDAYLGSSHAARSEQRLGDLGTVTVTQGRYCGELAASFATVISSTCGLLAFGGTSLAVNPVATLVIAAVGGVLLLAIRPLRARSRAAAKDSAAASRSIGAEVAQIETLHREIEVFHSQEQVATSLTTPLAESASAIRRLLLLSNLVPQLFQAVLLGAAVLSLLVVVTSNLTANLAAVGAVVLLLIRSMSAAQQLVTSSQRLIEQGAHARSLGALVGDLDAAAPQFGEERPASVLPLQLRSVDFSYDGDTVVLHDLDCTLSNGELVGIAGPSGAGKSTFVELLLRLRTPTTGDILAGGSPLTDIDPVTFAQRVAFVPQYPVMLVGSIAQNVAFYRDIPEERLRHALAAAHVLDEVEQLPQGIHTRIGPETRALSGGQRQRVAIARALAGDPECLVLDEPTSALDVVSERAVRQMLVELPLSRLVLVVAHRYSTLRSCSRILVFRDGELEIDASPDFVAEQSDFFRAMVDEGEADSGEPR